MKMKKSLNGQQAAASNTLRRLNHINSGLLSLLIIALLLTACGSRQKTTTEQANPESLKFLYAGTQALIHHEFLLALSLADSAEKYTPGVADADFLRGRVLSEVGRCAEAEQAYRSALAKNPDYRGVWHNMANNEYRRHEYYKAVKYYETALAEQPSPMSWRGLGRTYIELGKK